MSRIRFATRGSPLALWQTRRVAQLVLEHAPRAQVVETVIRTRGDEDATSPLPEIGGAGLFTAALEHALRSGAADAAVHSLKDLPIEQRPGLVIGAVCLREDARDVLISGNGATLHELASGSVIGTSSHRRSAQVLAVRNDVEIRPIRGNVETRIARVDAGEYDATILAAAGVRRLGLEARIAEWLPIETFLPAPGQGALAVQCRRDDAPMLELLAAIDEPGARLCTDAERLFLALLGGGCSLPVAAWATLDGEAMQLRGFVGSMHGGRVIRVEERSDRGHARVAAKRLAQRAIDQGALALLAP